MSKATAIMFEGYFPKTPLGDAAPADVLRDLSRFGNDGAFLGAGEPAWVQLKTGKWVLKFDGNNDSVDLGAGTSLTNFSTAKTVLAWVKAGAFTGSTRHVFDAGYWNATYGDRFGLKSGTNQWDFRIRDTAGGVQTGVFDFTPNVWQLIGYTWDGTTITYVKNAISVTTPDAFAGPLACTNANPYLGRQSHAADQHYDGYIGAFLIARYGMGSALEGETIPGVVEYFESTRRDFGV